MKKLWLLLLLASISPAAAQWQVPNYCDPIGRGSGSGFKSACPASSGTIKSSNGAAADPSYRTLSSILDSAACSTAGSSLWRSSTGWVCVSNVPVTVSSSGAVTTANSRVFCDATGGAVTITLPAVATSSGFEFTVKKIDSSANACTIAPASGNIDGSANYPLNNQYEWVRVISNATQWWVQ
jgi:hypothetical protein